MAFVDLNTEKIYGCKEQSYTWYHEKGHLLFNKSDFGNKLSFWKENIFVLLVLSLTLIPLFKSFFIKFLPFSLGLIYALAYFFEEAWCWGYAFRIKRRMKYEKKQNN